MKNLTTTATITTAKPNRIDKSKKKSATFLNITYKTNESGSRKIAGKKLGTERNNTQRNNQR